MVNDKLKVLALVNENVMLTSIALILHCQKMNNKKQNKKRYSAKWLLKRESEGFSTKLLREITEEDTKLFRTILRISPNQFEDILRMVTPYIQKNNTNFRNCIPPAERLQVTLVYLATGLTQTYLQIVFRIQQSTISKIIKETVAAIYEALNREYLKFPERESDWIKISRQFYDLWGFPNCLGAIDGKHCKIKPLNKFGSNYWCYKGSHTFILMAIADANYRFTYVDVGVNGRIGDACLWSNCDLKNAIEDDKVKIPMSTNLPLTATPSPFTFISDDAFPLSNYMMKPYSHVNLTIDQMRFNYILSRNRRVVENAFGILANRFQVFFTPIFKEPAQAIKVVLACVCLHNYLRIDNVNKNINIDNLSESEINGIIQNHYDDLTPTRRGRHSQQSSGITTRKTLEEYFKVFMNRFNVPIDH